MVSFWLLVITALLVNNPCKILISKKHCLGKKIFKKNLKPNTVNIISQQSLSNIKNTSKIKQII